MEEYSEPPEQSCLLRWTEKIASHCFDPSGDRTPYLLIRQTLIDCATVPGREWRGKLFLNDLAERVCSGQNVTKTKWCRRLIRAAVMGVPTEKKINKNKFGDLYSAYQALPGGSRR
jgi:hypothetical protein